MASTHKSLRSSTANKRPTTSIADGQIAVNTNSTSPGLFFKDSTGATIIKVGPVHVGTTAPNATPAAGGSSGNSTGEIWLDTSLTPVGVKIWNGGSWTNATPIGSTTVQGLLELATDAETQAGADTARAVTPAGLQSKVSDSTSTTSSTTIASSTAVKSAYDLANAALPKSGGTVTGNLEIGTTGSLTFEGSTADGFETALAVVDPTADNTITLPNVSGTVVTTGDTGTVTSTMIADGTIVNGDISATAEIAVSKLADGDARQLLQTDAAGTGVEWASNIDIPGTLDVTSAATFDSSATIVGDLTVDTNTLKVDSTNNRVGIGVSSPGVLLELGTATPILRFSDTNTTGYHQIQSNNAILLINADPSDETASSTIGFNVDGTERARIDSSGRMLVGVTSTSADSRAIIEGRSAGSTGNGVLYLSRGSTPGTNGNPLGTLNFSDSGHVANAAIEAVRDGASYTSGSDQPAALTFSTTADGTATLSERVRIDSSGRVGIGTTSPSSLLHIYENSTSGATVTLQNTDGEAYITANNDFLYLDANSHIFRTQTGSERARIDSSGRLLVGTSANRTNAGIQLEGTSTSYSVFSIINNQTGAGQNGSLIIGRSKGSTVGSNTVVASGDTLGELFFQGTDGTALRSAASISAFVDETPGASDMPGRLVFSTTADGASTPTERLRIDSSGRVGIGTTSPGAELHVNPGSGNVGNIFLDYGTGSTADGRLNVEVGSSAVLYETLKTGGLAQAWYVTGAERMRIDTSGRLLVGTSTALETFGGTLLQVANAAGATAVLGRDDSTVTTDDPLGSIYFNTFAGGAWQESATIRCFADAAQGSGDVPSRLVFSTCPDSSATPVERMRITNDGIIAIGNTAATNLNTIQSGTPTSFWISTTGTTSNPPAEFYGNSTGNRFHICFSNSNGVVGSIRTNATATAYLTSSDYRLKENVVAVTDGITRLQQLKPSRFNFIVDPDVTVDGFLAHEAQTVVPECVSGTKDEVDENGNPIYQGIDQSKLVPLLTAALQEAVAKIESLEARLTAAGI